MKLKNPSSNALQSKKIVGLIVLIGAIFLLPLVAGEYSYIYQKDMKVDLIISCFDSNNSACSSATPCSITVFYPNSTVMIRNMSMTYNGTYYNYTLTSDRTGTVGEYSAVVMCVGSDAGFSTFNFMINARGKEITTGDSLMYLGGLLLLILFLVVCIVGFTRMEKPTGKLLFAYGIYILLIGISYIVWITTENILSTSIMLSRIFYWIFMILIIGFLPMLLCSFILYVWLLMKMRTIRVMIEKGMTEDEAFERAGKRRGFR